MDHPEAYLGRLKPIYIFRGLSDAEILEVAEELEVEQYKAGDTIFEQGEEGQHFYIIHRGQVKVLRGSGGHEPKQVATLVPGDFFGEGSLLYGRRRSATIQAESDVELLRLSKEDFDDLLRRYPHIKPNLLVSHESHELYRRHKFSWLGPDEVVYLIARRHRVVLYQALVLPLLAGLIIAGVTVWLAVLYEALWVAWTGAALEIPVALWLLWNRIDWSNDYYIVTNKRLVHLEKIVGIYDSRLEAPLGSIMSVNVQTDDTIQRVLGMGDVVVRTFSGPIVLSSVANPNSLAAMVEEHWHRTRTREREAQAEQMRRVLRERIETGKPPPPKPVEVRRPAPENTRVTDQLANFISFRMRFEQGGNVIYRKHWAMLLRDVWQPTLGMLALVIVITLAVAGLLPAAIPVAAVLLVGAVACLPLAGWWLYQYIDWRNDIYMVTHDQIFDIVKKPLGQETKKSAPLSNVLSLKYERPGLLGLLLNYGTVIAQVAGTEFRFDGVFDPVGVQNDVYRRIEAFNTKKAQNEAAKRRDEMVDWLTVYHKVHDDMVGDHEHQPGAPEARRGSPPGRGTAAAASPADEPATTGGLPPSAAPETSRGDAFDGDGYAVDYGDFG